MVYVPPGTFWMGANKDGNECPTNAQDPSGTASELPCHSVTVPGFLVDKYEVTKAAYQAYYDANGGVACKNPGDGASCTPSNTSTGCNWWATGYEQRPLTCVSWYQMDGYCKGMGRRLCSEAEWERAARGSDGRLYPWGNQNPTCIYTVMGEGGYGCGTGSTMEVGSKTPGASPYGAMDMAGNVLEWVDDWFHDTYGGAPIDGSAWVSPVSSKRVARGGSYGDSAVWQRTTVRFAFNPASGAVGLGSRCCMSPP